MRNPDDWAAVRLAELCGANFDPLLEEVGELKACLDKDIEKAEAMEKRLKNMPDIRTEGEAPSLEDIEAAIAQADDEEEERERLEALERRQLQEEIDEEKRKTRQEFFASAGNSEKEKSDDYEKDF